MIYYAGYLKLLSFPKMTPGEVWIKAGQRQANNMNSQTTPTPSCNRFHFPNSTQFLLLTKHIRSGTSIHKTSIFPPLPVPKASFVKSGVLCLPFHLLQEWSYFTPSIHSFLAFRMGQCALIQQEMDIGRFLPCFDVFSRSRVHRMRSFDNLHIKSRCKWFKVWDFQLSRFVYWLWVQEFGKLGEAKCR